MDSEQPHCISHLMIKAKTEGCGDPVLMRQRSLLQSRVAPLIRGVGQGHGYHVM